MHILRHFTHVPKRYADSLLGKSYEYYDRRKKRFVKSVVTERIITTALGPLKDKSKFFPNVRGFETPLKVIQWMRREVASRTLRWTDEGKYDTTKFTFTNTLPVGQDHTKRRQTRRVGVELVRYKGTDFAFVTAYPFFRGDRKYQGDQTL